MNITGNFLLCVSLNYYIKYLWMHAYCKTFQKKKEEKFDEIITKNNGEKMKELREGFPIPRF